MSSAILDVDWALKKTHRLKAVKRSHCCRQTFLSLFLFFLPPHLGALLNAHLEDWSIVTLILLDRTPAVIKLCRLIMCSYLVWFAWYGSDKARAVIFKVRCHGVSLTSIISVNMQHFKMHVLFYNIVKMQRFLMHLIAFHLLLSCHLKIQNHLQIKQLSSVSFLYKTLDTTS